MASPNRPARLNRTLLLLVAVVLLLIAAFALFTAFGVLADRLTGLPARDATLTPTAISPPAWVSYATLLVAVVVGLLALRWLLAQAQRRPKTSTWNLESDPAQGATRLAAQAAVGPLVDEIETIPGVHRASARLSGVPTRPILHIVVGTEDSANIQAVRRQISGEAIPRLRQALDLEHLPADVLIRLDDARSARLA